MYYFKMNLKFFGKCVVRVIFFWEKVIYYLMGLLCRYLGLFLLKVSKFVLNFIINFVGVL